MYEENLKRQRKGKKNYTISIFILPTFHPASNWFLEILTKVPKIGTHIWDKESG